MLFQFQHSTLTVRFRAEKSLINLYKKNDNAQGR